MRKYLAAALVGALAVSLVGGGYAVGSALIGSDQIKNHGVKRVDLAKGLNRRIALGLRRPLVRSGINGTNGANGLPGAPGAPAQTPVASLPGQGFSVTNSSCELTPDGVACGPYVDGGAAGGSLYFDGLNGQPLSVLESLVYFARYVSEGDTGGVGVPYLRIFLQGDAHDAVFSPNTQPPDPDTEEGPFHTWVATSGVWRYDDDAGAGGPGTYGVNGAPFATLVADHGTEAISGIYITTGFSAGTNLASLIRSLQVNDSSFSFSG